MLLQSSIDSLTCIYAIQPIKWPLLILSIRSLFACANMCTHFVHRWSEIICYTWLANQFATHDHPPPRRSPPSLSLSLFFFLQRHTPKRLDRYAHYDSDTHTLAYAVRLLSARSACRPSCRQPWPGPAIGDRCTWFMRFTYQRTDEARWCADNDRCSDIDRDIDTSQAWCGRMSRWACATPLK